MTYNAGTWVVVIVGVAAAMACVGAGEDREPLPRAASVVEHAPPDPAATVAAPDPSTPPVQWRGPDLHRLEYEDVTAGVGLRSPTHWSLHQAGASVGLESPAGSTLSAELSCLGECGDLEAARAAVRGAPQSHDRPLVELAPDHFRQPGPTGSGVEYWLIETPIGARILRCEFAVVERDLTLLDALSTQCAQPVVDFAPDDRIAWSLSVAPAKIRRGGAVDITYGVTNRANMPVDARAPSLEWAIDGAASSQLDMAFGNGGHAKIWYALPPGEHLEEGRTGMDLDLSVGAHTITLSHLGHEIARATVRVRG